jgi:GxxExxY protein
MHTDINNESDREDVDLVMINNITEKIIKCAFTVSNSLGVGFLEKVYENALAVEFQAAGISFSQQHSLPIFYRENLIGDYFADFLVENSVLLELKAVKNIDEIHLAQCMNYLKATRLKVCLLINFGTKRVQIKRIIN